MPAATMTLPDFSQSSGGRLVATDGRTLPLTGTLVRAEAESGLARVTLEQRFVNPYDEPLRLSYLVPLPEDGVVSGYAFRLGDRNIVGVVEPRAKARESFERALAEGRSAALLDQERGSVFTQLLGNVPPRAEIVCTLTIDQRLVWVDEGAWEWRFPTVVAPRYLGAEGRIVDAARISVEVADGAIAAAARLALVVKDTLTGAVSSPSHAIATRSDAAGHEVSLTSERGAALDRDLVVRWPVAVARVGVSLRTTRAANAPFAYGLVSLVAPTPEHVGTAVGRDLCLLLDTSGSMDGAPLAQACRIASALVDSLGDRDQLEMIEFGDRPRRWKSGSTIADAANRKHALAWLRSLRASGGTEMTAGIMEALSTLRPDAQRQVVLVTDGQIGFEQEVLAQICARLPAHSRLHVVGVGSAVNRSLTRPAARAGGGIEVVVGIDEDAERAAARIVRRTARPLVTDLRIEGSALVEHAPQRSADLFAGAPAFVSLRLRAEGGELVVRGRHATGAFEDRMVVPPITDGASLAVAALFARERVADLELALAAGGERVALDGEIERLGLDFQIATRLTSFVAVSDRVDVDRTAPVRDEVMPHALPHGMSAAGLGLRPPMAPPPSAVAAAPMFAMRALKQAMELPATVAQDVDGASRDEIANELEEHDAFRPSEARPASRGIGAPSAPPKAQRPAVPRAPGASRPAKPSARPFFSRVRAAIFGAASHSLVGRIVRLSPALCAVDITLTAALSWSLPTSTSLRTRDGALHVVTLDADASTRAGEHAAGLRLRLVLHFAGLVSEAASLELTLDDGSTLSIRLEGTP